MTPTMLTPLESILRTTKKHLTVLHERGIKTVEDMLLYFPREYENRSHITDLSEIRGDKKNVLLGNFISVRAEKSKRGFELVKAMFLEEKSQQTLECVWFNQKYLSKTLPLHQRMMIVGKAKLAFGKISFQSPSYEVYDGEVSGGLYPLYSEHMFLSGDWFFRKIHEDILPLIRSGKINIPNIIPAHIRTEKQFLSRNEALQILHYPKDEQSLTVARNTLAFEELFVLQICSLKRKESLQNAGEGSIVPIPLEAEMMTDFFKTLPFTPTNAQKIALFEILKDYEKSVPMQRMLEGDVGSGKTLVAVCALIPLLREKKQGALIAPTEILASQLAFGVQKFLEQARDHQFWEKWGGKTQEGVSYQPKVSFLTGSVTGKKREQILFDLRSGEIDILVGTHALLEDTVEFHDLGLVIVDEQHRFGVLQRERLIAKGNPHFLQMSATPIPRSLAIVAFGDQDLSVLSELPPGRKPIETKVISPEERTTVDRFTDDQIEKGRQVFVICPLVEESEHFDELKSATEEYLRLKEHIFPHRRVVLLHGKMKPKDKESIMNAFKNHEYDILVSTSVVEVGVDVPNATIMMIEGAERFGLSQLHQFRGRVGRGKDKSYAFLCPTKTSENARLRAMEKTQNGFELAEIDMNLRGAGEVFGFRQSGLPDLHMANMMDGRLVRDAKESAEHFLSSSRIEEYQALERAVDERNKKMTRQ